MAQRTSEMLGRIKQLRKILGVTQEELASKMKINRAYWSAVETGKRSITSKMMMQLCVTFNVSIDWLITGIGHPTIGQPMIKIDSLSAVENSIARLVTDDLSKIRPLVLNHLQLRSMEHSIHDGDAINGEELVQYAGTYFEFKSKLNEALNSQTDVPGQAIGYLQGLSKHLQEFYYTQNTTLTTHLLEALALGLQSHKITVAGLVNDDDNTASVLHYVVNIDELFSLWQNQS